MCVKQAAILLLVLVNFVFAVCSLHFTRYITVTRRRRRRIAAS